LCVNGICEYISNVIRRFIPLKLRPLFRFKVFEKLYRLVGNTDPVNSASRLLIYKRELINYAFNEEHIEILRSWYDGNEKNLKDHKLRITEKWSIIEKIFGLKGLSKDQKLKYYEEMYKEDPSDFGRKAKLYCDALIAEDEEREATWQGLNDASTTRTYKELYEV